MKNKVRYYLGMSFYFGSDGVEYDELPEYGKLITILKKETEYEDGDWLEEFINVAQPRCDVYRLVRKTNDMVSPDVMEMLDKNGNVVPDMDFGVFLKKQKGLDFIHKYYFDIELVFAYVGTEFDYEKIMEEGERISEKFKEEWMKLGEDRKQKVEFNFDREFMGETDKFHFDLGEGVYKQIK